MYFAGPTGRGISMNDLLLENESTILSDFPVREGGLR